MISPLKNIKWFIGTMGFSFQDWIGVFYPRGLIPEKFLSYYSRFFNSVEIDSTFYGTPNRSTLLRWKSVTPAGFKISVKMPRSITHDGGLRNVEYETNEFIDAVQNLEEKLGVVLIQMPPFFNVDFIETLDQFLKTLPNGNLYAIEVRDKSWFKVDRGEQSPKLVNILSNYNICWAATEYPLVPSDIYTTADFLYVRWIGIHGTFSSFTEVSIDREENLKEWVKKLNSKSSGINSIYGYFNNDYSGFSPLTANEFKEFAGLQSTDFQFPIQSKMF
jgi:uncharacterized protein YecE (DUF72 family)